MKKTIQLALICATYLAPAYAVKKATGIPIPSGSRVYIEPGDYNFYLYLASAIMTKHTPVTIVSDRSQAEFIITVVSSHGKDPSTAEKWLLGKYGSDQDASAVVKNTDGVVCFAYSVHKFNSAHGAQSTAEAIAKHLKWYILGINTAE
ncbi:MAG TPA: hypothetical protein VG206_02755 [Terriglobia bacterium]|nr:hypothetical protein [Terriglobia bacterium]